MVIATPLFCVLLAILSHGPKSTPAPTPWTPTPVTPSPVQPPAPVKPRPGSQVEWISFPAQKSLRDASWGNVLTDIENHLPESMGTQYRDRDKITWAHETTHGIHSHLNNTLNEMGSREYYCLYVLDNKVAKIKQPKITIQQVAGTIPPGLRKSRYQLYLVQQAAAWGKEPIYIWDEWVAYVNGADCGVELQKKKLYDPGKQDSVWGCLEFNVYAVYVAIAQKKLDPTYDNKRMLEFLAYNLERSMKIYNDGTKADVFNWDDHKYLQEVRTGGSASEFRRFVIETWGAPWAKEVFGFEK